MEKAEALRLVLSLASAQAALLDVQEEVESRRLPPPTKDYLNRRIKRRREAILTVYEKILKGGGA